MSIPLDWLSVIVLTAICISYCLKLRKSSERKVDSTIAIVTAVLTLLIYFFSDLNSSRQQKELIAISEKTENDLNKRISMLQAHGDSLQNKLKGCQISLKSTILGNDNNSTQINGNKNTAVSGTGNVVISGTDGSTINYNPIDKPFFETKIDISEFQNTGIKVNKGDQVFITATGSIKVGAFVGYSGPDGLASGVAGFSLEQYNIVKTFKHAALMFKLNQNDDWTQCGSQYKFKAKESGELFFQVNDNHQSDNLGAYEVTIQKYRATN